MKRIFDFPYNEDTQYIDPDYVGGSNAGFFKRINELKDGNYRAWNADAPVETVNDLMSNISKFADYYDYINGNDQISLESFYQYPLVVAYKKLIDSETISSADTDSTAATITHSTGEFTTGDQIVLNGMNGTWEPFQEMNVFYANVLSATTMNLRVGASDGPFLRFYNLQDANQITSATAADPCVFTDSSHDLTSGTLVKMTEFDGDLAIWNGTDFYAQVIDSSTFNLSFDSAGTDLLRFTQILDTGILDYDLDSGDVAVKFTIPSGSVVRDQSELVVNSTYRDVKDAGGGFLGDSGRSRLRIIEDLNNGVKFTKTTYDGATEAFVDDYTEVESFPTGHEFNYQGWTVNKDLDTLGAYYYRDWDDGYTVVWMTVNASNVWSVQRAYDIGSDEPISLTMSGSGDVIFVKQTNSYDEFGSTPRITKLHKVNSYNWTIEETVLEPRDTAFDNHWFDNTSNRLYTNTAGTRIFYDAEQPELDESSTGYRWSLWEWPHGTTPYKRDDIEGYPTNTMSVDDELRYYLAYDGTDVVRYKLSSNIDLVELLPVTDVHQVGIGEVELAIAFEDGVAIYNFEDDAASTFHQQVSLPGNVYYNAAIPSEIRIPDRENRGFIYPRYTSSHKVLVRTTFNMIMDSILSTPKYLKAHPTIADHWLLYNDHALTEKFDYTSINTVNNPEQFNTTTVATLGTTVDIDPNLVDSTTGDVREVKTPDDIGQIVLTDPTAATTGEIAIATSDPYRYELSSVDLMINGNQVYKHLTAEDTYTFAAEVDDEKYYEAFASFPVPVREPRYVEGRGETMPDFTVGVDSNGYLDSISLVDGAGSEGKFANNNPICLFIKSPADTYTPAPLSAAQLQDVYDTDDEWSYTSFNSAKVWPNTVSPARINWEHDMPSSTSYSMNGKKYARTSGYQKMQLEVTYPPLTAEQFAELAGFAQAMQGQVHPVNFPLTMANGKYLLPVENPAYNNGNRYLREPASAGDYVIHVHGYASGEENCCIKGEMIRIAGNVNGGLYTVVNTASANEYGEVKIRLSHPLDQNLSAGDTVIHKPDRVTVTLAEDGFIYGQRLDGFYDLTVTFETDEWKG